MSNNFDSIMSGFTSGTNQSSYGEPVFTINPDGTHRQGRRGSYNNAGGEEIKLRSLGSRKSGRSSNGNNADVAESNRHLENMSESVLNNLTTEYKKQLSFVKSADEKNTLQSRIDAISGEFAKRRSGNMNADGSANATVSEQIKKTLPSKTSIGTTALAFGILLGVGSFMVGSKHPIKWGLAGAGLGVVTVFYLSSDGKEKIITPVQTIKDK